MCLHRVALIPKYMLDVVVVRRNLKLTLKILSTTDCGAQLRKDDPGSLKDMVLLVQQCARPYTTDVVATSSVSTQSNSAQGIAQKFQVGRNFYHE